MRTGESAATGEGRWGSGEVGREVWEVGGKREVGGRLEGRKTKEGD